MINSLGFTGSSDGGMPTSKQKTFMAWFIKSYKPKHGHHGDCINSDKVFHAMCLAHGMIIHIHPPTNPKKRAFCAGGDIEYLPAPYLKRNRNIVAMSDVLLATPHGPEELRSGTWATIRYAKQKGIQVYIVYPNGKVEIVPEVTKIVS